MLTQLKGVPMSEILRVSPTLLHEEADGTLVEYRRVFYHKRACCVDLEHRAVQADGQPYNGDWYAVSDDHRVWLQRQGSDIPQLLSEETAS